jgi:hypothetical protein
MNISAVTQMPSGNKLLHMLLSVINNILIVRRKQFIKLDQYLVQLKYIMTNTWCLPILRGK